MSLFLAVTNYTNSMSILGRKSGKGWFLYDAGSKSKPENPGALDLLKNFAVTPTPGYVTYFLREF